MYVYINIYTHIFIYLYIWVERARKINKDMHVCTLPFIHASHHHQSQLPTFLSPSSSPSPSSPSSTLLSTLLLLSVFRSTSHPSNAQLLYGITASRLPMLLPLKHHWRPLLASVQERGQRQCCNDISVFIKHHAVQICALRGAAGSLKVLIIGSLSSFPCVHFYQLYYSYYV